MARASPVKPKKARAKKAPIAGLGPIALALLEKRHASRVAPLAPKALTALLEEKKRPVHAAALSFEKTYGGLSFTEAGETKDGERFTVGVGACLGDADLSFHEAGEHGLMPVIWAPNDVAYFIAADGSGWGQDTIEDPAPVRVAPNARAMLTRLLLGEHVFVCPEKKKAEAATGGAAIAKALKLKAIADASDDAERWWSDGKSFLVERDGRTTLAFASAKALGLVAKPRAPKTGPVTFDTIDDFDVSLVTEAAEKTPAEAYAAFLDPARHAQPATIDARVGGAISLAGGTFAGTITELDPGARIQLTLTGDKGYAKKTSRVEIFFRLPLVKTLVNVFQFGVKPKAADAMQDVWFETIFAPWVKSAPPRQ